MPASPPLPIPAWCCGGLYSAILKVQGANRLWLVVSSEDEGYGDFFKQNGLSAFLDEENGSKNYLQEVILWYFERWIFSSPKVI